MRKATLLSALALLLTPLGALAQGAQCDAAPLVTLRQINTIPAENLARLDAAGAALTVAQINAEIAYPFQTQIVRFRAVVLSDWRNSGLATINAQGIPGRIHVFVRDVNAATQGFEGMATQIVDDTGSGLMQNFEIGDVVNVCGRVAPFSSNGLTRGMQINPVAGGVSLADVEAFARTAPIMQPVAITTDDIHKTVAGPPEGQNTQVRWLNFNRYNSEYVRLEGVQIVQGVPANTGRPNVLYQSVGQQTLLPQYDTSLRFRNDRATTYPATYNRRPANNPFVPPATGIANVQGFLVLTGTDGGFNVATPRYANFVINPMEDADFVVTAAPPITSRPGKPADVPGNAPATVTATVVPGTAQNTITGAVLRYTVFQNGVATGPATDVAMTNTAGDVWGASVPAAADGALVSYQVVATDNAGQTSTSPPNTYLVSYGPVARIEQIQRPAPATGSIAGAAGDSPLAGVTTARLNLNAVVQAVFTSGSNRFAILQDDAGLAPWTGVWARLATGQDLAPGDRITVTGARVQEVFFVTELDQLVYTRTATGAPYPHKVVSTTLFNGPEGAATAEAHEGMLLRFENVTVTRLNADGPDTAIGNGEWRFSSTGQDADGLRADDLSDAFAPNFATTTLKVGDTHAFMQGALYFSFSNYKLIPTATADIGAVTGSTSNEPVAGGEGRVRLSPPQPNPFAGTTVIRYEVVAPGPVSLRVYDVTGREVATLVDGHLAPSAYEASFDARGLASGVYVYRLVTGDQVLTGRMTLVR